MAPGDDLLRVEDLRTHFFTYHGVVRAVDGVSLAVREGERVGLVGESGSGKSVTALSVLRLVPEPPGRVVGGHVWWRGRDLLSLTEREMNRIRGNDIAMVFQEPMTSLNPVFPVGSQLVEVALLHREDVGRRGLADAALARLRLRTPQERRRVRAARSLAVEALREVGIPDPARVARLYPHELSGGMRQRAMIAMAMLAHPRLLIADEPTTALDVTIQAQILELMERMQRQHGSAVLLITHHLGVVAEFCQRVDVMYRGKLVEEAPTEELFGEPMHPYTRGLLGSIPDLTRPPKSRLSTVRDVRRAAQQEPCPFHDRCLAAEARGEDFPFVEVRPGHKVACLERSAEVLFA